MIRMPSFASLVRSAAIASLALFAAELPAQTVARTVALIDDPFSPFRTGELQDATFIGVNTPADGVNENNYTLTLSLGGVDAYFDGSRPGEATIGQAGFAGALTGTTTVNSMEILFWDGFSSFSRDGGEGTNVILLQTAALSASGADDIFDMALVFDLEDRPTWPISGELTNVFLVCDPISGSFTIDSAIAAAAMGPTAPHVPEPSTTLLVGAAAAAACLRRRRRN